MVNIYCKGGRWYYKYALGKLDIASHHPPFFSSGQNRDTGSGTKNPSTPWLRASGMASILLQTTGLKSHWFTNHQWQYLIWRRDQHHIGSHVETQCGSQKSQKVTDYRQTWTLAPMFLAAASPAS